ncbi:MAG: anthranilate synthase component I family protein [Deltaproteobacteria bacterium]|nr:anthranilate synthase component I family protein [Deltaproteobacteria bacterium]
MPAQELRLARTPVEVLTAAAWPRPFVFDGGGPQSWGNGFALFGHTPRATLRVEASGTAQWTGDGSRRQLLGHPLDLIEQFRRTYARRVIDEPTTVFAGGLVAALSYDLKHWIERLPARARDDQGLPVLECAWYDWALVFDYRTRAWQLASSFLTAGELHAVGQKIMAATRATPAPAAQLTASLTHNVTHAEYIAAVRRALAYIAAGDIYQVNLAQRFDAAVRGMTPRAAAATLFAHWQQRHPMPFAAYLDCADFTVISNSPECFLQLTPATIATFPIKGTRPRGMDNAHDVANALALRTDAKEAAEHVMIVDLERNDLGRLCQPGSVEVTEFATVQSYPTLHHLVSAVHGRRRAGIELAEILSATFPGGSITGAPKIRAMEIIDELEPVRRGFYTGAVGFLDAHGAGCFNIAIRTALGCGDKLTFHAGGAIVADSDPQAEYEETLLKARAFCEAWTGREGVRV